MPACKAVQCRQMSNYMIYLLFVKPDMLLPGSRPDLFIIAYKEHKVILEEHNPASTAKGFKLNQILRGCTPKNFYGILKGLLKRDKPHVQEKRHMQTIFSKLESMEDSKKVVFIHDAWVLAKKLQDLAI